MKVLMNFKKAWGLSGGASSFLSTLQNRLKREGLVFTDRIEENFDIALLNALTDGLSLNEVRRIHAKKRPVIHRKVGYRVSGSPDMREMTDGVVWGDKLQVEFSPYIHHTVFQSQYSRDVFLSSGFVGDYSVIHNGVDTGIFNQTVGSGLFGMGSRCDRAYWDGASVFRLAIVTWSKDENKGFAEYCLFDEALDRLPNVEIWFIGRCPDAVRFRNIKTFSARGKRRLAALLKQCHGFVQMARWETCSNALIEAINCGLPAIYVDSGSNREIAADYGVVYQGSPEAAIDALQTHYSLLAERVKSNPFSIDHAAQSYVSMIERVMRKS
jgi:glycosyltransferase involved in cell wall biosynthesis